MILRKLKVLTEHMQDIVDLLTLMILLVLLLIQMFLAKMVLCIKKLTSKKKLQHLILTNIEQLIKKHIEAMLGHDSLTNFYENYRNSIFILPINLHYKVMKD